MVRGEQVTATGAWSIPPAFSYKVDVGIVDGIAQLAGNNASVLDIGAGKGLYVRAWTFFSFLFCARVQRPGGSGCNLHSKCSKCISPFDNGFSIRIRYRLQDFYQAPIYTIFSSRQHTSHITHSQ